MRGDEEVGYVCVWLIMMEYGSCFEIRDRRTCVATLQTSKPKEEYYLHVAESSWLYI